MNDCILYSLYSPYVPIVAFQSLAIIIVRKAVPSQRGFFVSLRFEACRLALRWNSNVPLIYACVGIRSPSKALSN